MLSPEKKKALRNNLILVGASLIFAGILGEVALRMIDTEPIVFTDDPYLERRVVSGTDWDERGYHNEQALDRADIVAIGDSMTQGVNALREEAWPQVLGKVSGRTVYQMALGGYGAAQYKYLFEKALDLHPSTIVVGFYFGNDLYDAFHMVYGFDTWASYRDPAYTRNEELPDASDKTARETVVAGSKEGTFARSIFDLRLWVRNHSKIYALLGDATRSLREKLGLAHDIAEKAETVSDLANENPELVYVYRDGDNMTYLSPVYRFEVINLDNPQTAEGWRITQQMFREMAESAREQNIDLIFAAIPTKELVYLTHLHERDGVVPEAFIEYEQKETELASEFDRFCAENSLSCFSFLPGMVDALSDHRKIYSDVTFGGHPNAVGYEVMGEDLARFLKERVATSSPVIP